MKHTREDYNRFQDPLNLIPEDEPVFLLRGQDKYAVETLNHYLKIAEEGGAETELLAAVTKMRDWMKEWPIKKEPNL